MVNSPGTSTASYPTSPQPKVSDFGSSSDGNSKKKRTRRRKRSKQSKSEKEDPSQIQTLQERFHTVFYDSKVQPFVQNPLVACDIFKFENCRKTAATTSKCAVVYGQRDKSKGPIKINSYIQNGTIPHIFKSKFYRDYEEELKIIQLGSRIADVSIRNGPARKPVTQRVVPEKLTKQDIVAEASSVPAKIDNVEKKKKKKEKKAKTKKRSAKIKNYPEYISVESVASGLKSGELIRGCIRINPKNFKQSYVGNLDNTKTDYMMSSVLDRNRALEGDEVVLSIKPASKEQKHNIQVVHIMKKVHPRTAVGYLETMENDKTQAIFQPRDPRVPKMVIPKLLWPCGFEAAPNLYKEILFVAKINEWTDVEQATGTLVENLGVNGDLKVESKAILREFLLDTTPHGNEVKKYMPQTSEIAPEELEYRKDCRQDCVFTIDPATARDLDDAVSCKELPDGNFQVAVHISDASFFLPEKTSLDEKVRQKATTIYMVDTAYHMLPTELCLYCSLLPGLDKLTFTVFWTLTPEGDIVETEISRSIINSCAQLSYEHAQMMIENPDRVFCENDLPKIHNGFTYKDLSKAVNNLGKIAVNLRRKRELNGALKIDQIKLAFTLDPATGCPTGFSVYENKPAHRLIEEFMLLANMSVAEFIYKAFPDLAFLRRHDPPKYTMVQELQQILETVGIHIDVSSSKGIQTSLQKYFSPDFLGQARMAVLNHLFTKPMQRALYFCTGAALQNDFSHFALSVPLYTHFTSPIRRYADIMVHRLLSAALKYTDKPDWDVQEVADIATTCNRQKYHAKRAGDASCDLYLAHFIEKHQPFVTDAVVVDTRERYCDVIVLKTGSVVRINTNSFPEGVKWKSEDLSTQLQTKQTDAAKKMWRIIVDFPKTDKLPSANVLLEMFTLVRVKLARIPKTNKLNAELLRPDV